MKKLILFLSGIFLALAVQAQPHPDTVGDIIVQPVEHASLALSAGPKHIWVDPVGHADFWKGMPAPDLLLITDIHGDHFSVETLESLPLEHTVLVVPAAVAEKLPPALRSKAQVMKNGTQKTLDGILFKAIPMYNLPESPDAFHTKGRGNGYVLTLAGKRIYISGDTEDIPEMRALKDIDIAFVCMTLPYTMDVDQAAAGVLAFAPSVVYPYHYRGKNGKSDVEVFRDKVHAANPAVDVRLLDWYSFP